MRHLPVLSLSLATSLLLAACGGVRPAATPLAPAGPRALDVAAPQTTVTALVVKQFVNGDYRPVERVRGGELARLEAQVSWTLPPVVFDVPDPEEPYVYLEARDQDGDRLGKVLVAGHPTPTGAGSGARVDFVRIPTYAKAFTVTAPAFYQRRSAPAGLAGRRAEGRYEGITLKVHLN